MIQSLLHEPGRTEIPSFKVSSEEYLPQARHCAKYFIFNIFLTLKATPWMGISISPSQMRTLKLREAWRHTRSLRWLTSDTGFKPMCLAIIFCLWWMATSSKRTFLLAVPVSLCLGSPGLQISLPNCRWPGSLDLLIPQTSIRRKHKCWFWEFWRIKEGWICY